MSGCLSTGSGPLTNFISVPSAKTKVTHKLPSGFCLDKSARISNRLKETLVITNCIAVNKDGLSYYSRRPVDTIIYITFTQSKIPSNISKKEYLSAIAKKMQFKKFLVGPNNKNLIYGEKQLQNKFFYVNLQKVNPNKQREFIRKYFFFVDNRVVVMTILSYQKPRKKTYSSFEDFIKKLI
jgi:hypothetical protein